MKVEMIILSNDFVEKNRDEKKGINQFGYAKTKDGIYVCDPNSVNDFPEFFKGMTIQKTMVDPSDVYDENGEPWIDQRSSEKEKNRS